MVLKSRRKRKRERRRIALERAERRGDRLNHDYREGGQGENAPDWSTARRGELRQLAFAIRHGWDVPVHRRRPIMRQVGEIIRNPGTLENARLHLAAAWVLVRASEQNVRILAGMAQEKRERDCQ